ncbi:GTPase-activator protein for Ras family GTPase [Pelomyxa schiedti]|nr:GTPase-activator protein for Ras family GTPase [Pelomyxa schiedti]
MGYVLRDVFVSLLLFALMGSAAKIKSPVLKVQEFGQFTVDGMSEPIRRISGVFMNDLTSPNNDTDLVLLHYVGLDLGLFAWWTGSLPPENLYVVRLSLSDPAAGLTVLRTMQRPSTDGGNARFVRIYGWQQYDPGNVVLVGANPTLRIVFNTSDPTYTTPAGNAKYGTISSLQHSGDSSFLGATVPPKTNPSDPWFSVMVALQYMSDDPNTYPNNPAQSFPMMLPPAFSASTPNPSTGSSPVDNLYTVCNVSSPECVLFYQSNATVSRETWIVSEQSSPWVVVAAWKDALFVLHTPSCDVNMSLPTCAVAVNIGSGFDYLCGALDSKAGFLFVGTADGYGVKINLTDSKMNSKTISFESGAIIGVVADPKTRTTFWLVKDQGIRRVQYDNFGYDSIMQIPVDGISSNGTCPWNEDSGFPDYQPYPIPAYGYINTEFNIGYFVGQKNIGCQFSTYVISFELSHCSQYTSCGECISETSGVGDKYYCAWDRYKQQCYPKYVNTTSPVDQKESDCIIETSDVSPTEVIDKAPQPLLITAYCNFSDDCNISTAESVEKLCVFTFDEGSKLNTTAKGTGNLVTCPTPYLEIGASKASVTATLELLFNRIPVFQSIILITFKSCENKTTCASCKGGCRWCTLGSLCTVNCTDEKAPPPECVTLYDANPRTSTVGLPETITISSSILPNFTDTVTLDCLWESGGNLTYTVATPQQKSFQCDSPSAASNYTLSVVYSNTVETRQPLYTQDSATSGMTHKNFSFVVQSCEVHTNCSSCRPLSQQNHSDSECIWCVDNVGARCLSKSKCSNGNTFTYTGDLCPSIASSTPQYVDKNTDVSSVDVTLTDDGGVITTLPTSLLYSCSWLDDLGNNYQASATGVSGRVITCPIPVSLFAKTYDFTASLQLYLEGSLFVEDTTSLELYSCTSTGNAPISNCTQCMLLNKEYCGWCLTTRTCASAGGCTTPTSSESKDGTLSQHACPSIDVTDRPTSTLSMVPGPITVTGNVFSTAVQSNLTCVLNASQVQQTMNSSVTVLSSTTARCNFDSRFAPLDSYNYASLGLTLTIFQFFDNQSILYASYAPTFILVDCSDSGSPNPASCTDCGRARPTACKWNLKSMECTMNTDNFTQANCPIISGVSPSSICAGETGSTIITIASDPETPEFGYNVSFGNLSTVPCNPISETECEAAIPLCSSLTIVPLVILRNDIKYTYNYYTFTYQYCAPSEESSSSEESVTKWIIIGAVCGFFVLLLLALGGLAGFAFYRRRKAGGDVFEFDLIKNKPDFTKLQYDGEFSRATPTASSSKRHTICGHPEQLAKALLNLSVARSVCEVTQATEADKVASSLVYVHASAGSSLKLISTFVEDEVTRVQNESLLFRANSFASKMFRSYSKLLGLEYLWFTLGGFLAEMAWLAQQDELKAQALAKLQPKAADADAEPTDTSMAASAQFNDFEVDPTKMKAGFDEEAQSYMLAERSRKLLVAVLRSKDRMPPQIRALVKCIREQVTKRFPDVENIAHIAIGGVIFLRFICPALTLPHVYGLLKAPPDTRLQRQVILLSKVIQNLANGVLFGGKEPYMRNMNEFISRNLDEINDWMDSLADVSDAEEVRVDLPPEVMEHALSFMQSHIETNRGKLLTTLQKNGVPQEDIDLLMGSVTTTTTTSTDN